MDREKIVALGEFIKKSLFDGSAKTNPAFDEGVILFTQQALAMLKEQEVRELTMDEWREWKNNSKRNPICELWEHDTSPMWVLNPDTIHEPALLMGKLKLFTGKPTFEQCKAVKWE